MIHKQIIKEIKRQRLTEYSVAKMVAESDACHFDTAYRYLLHNTTTNTGVIEAIVKILGMKIVGKDA